ncbi:MAG TPA: carbon storage regulator [Pirellulales bacterium]|nr:carbon storage regulator [Pirellulales bacterium]
MLVLTRKTQQQIQFGNDIVITILQVRGQSVRVGIEAPRGVRVVRGEIASQPARAKLPLSSRAPLAEIQGSQADEGATITRPVAHVETTTPAGGMPGPAAETFSSPASPQQRPVGEARGLFPRLRRRAQNAPQAESTSRPTR